LEDFIVEFTLLDTNQEVEYWTICTDGLSIAELRDVGIIVTSPKKDVLRNEVQLQFPATNNKAEYEAVLASLRIAKALRRI